MVKRKLRGNIENPETSMLNLIKEVGPSDRYLVEPRSAAMSSPGAWLPARIWKHIQIFPENADI